MGEASVTSSVAGDIAVISILGIATIARICTSGCHAKLRLPFPLPAMDLWLAWDQAEAEGWYILDPETTTTIDGDAQTQQFARQGVTSTFDECETP